MDVIQKRIIVIGLLLILVLYGYWNSEQTKPALSDNQKQLTTDYIEKYATFAVEEMQRCGIPASITLAQGILESGYGQSWLSRYANNHFGIKCDAQWIQDGKDRHVQPSNEWSKMQQKMVKKRSCFRGYNSPKQSYFDHSEFLRTRERYAPLFKFTQNDYRSWAQGLQDCGYATDPQYAEKLISLINRYELYKFDN